MKQATVNTFGALGYSSLLTQWFWTALTIGLPIVTSDVAKNLFLPPEQPANSQPIFEISLPNSVEIIIIIASVIFALGVMAYALLAVPRAIGRGGKRLTQAGAQAAAPRIAKQHHLSKKQQRRLIEKITWTIKALLVFVPLLLLAIPPGEALGLSHSITAASGLLFGLVSIVLFAIQFTLARMWHIPAKQVW